MTFMPKDFFIITCRKTTAAVIGNEILQIKYNKSTSEKRTQKVKSNVQNEISSKSKKAKAAEC